MVFVVVGKNVSPDPGGSHLRELSASVTVK